MGDDLVTYRLRIGRFVARSTCKYRQQCSAEISTVMLLLITGLLIAVIIERCGDVEKNPGPQLHSKKRCAACGSCSAARCDVSYFKFPKDRLVLSYNVTNITKCLCYVY